jgi:hypothetical protein
LITLKYIFSILVSFCLLDSFSQGRVDGFLKHKGELDAVVGVSYETSKSYFAGTDKISFTRNTTSYNAFFAYGVFDRLNVNVSVPYVNVNKQEQGLQDGAVFFKYKVLSKNKLNLLIAGGFSSNLSNYETHSGSAIGQQAKAIDIRPVLHYFASNGVFITAQGGYTYRFSPVPNSIPVAVKIGLAKAKYYVDVWYEYQYGIGGFDYRGTPTPPSFRELGVSFHKIGGTIYKPLSENIGMFGGLSYILSGRNISKGFGGNLGVVIKNNNKNE